MLSNILRAYFSGAIIEVVFKPELVKNMFSGERLSSWILRLVTGGRRVKKWPKIGDMVFARSLKAQIFVAAFWIAAILWSALVNLYFPA